MSAIGRMTQVLDAFGEDTELSQTDLVERTHLPKATIHRTVGLLVEFGWLQRLGDRYRFGTRLFEMGGRVVTTSRLREAAIPYLEDLYEATHEIVNLGVLDGIEVMYIEKIGSHRRIDTPARVGHRFPAHCTALGKAILSTAPADVIDRVISEGLTRRTDRTIVAPDLFRCELERVAAETIAIDDGEFAHGMMCFAAPIRGSGRAVAAVSVTGPRARMDLDAMRPHLERAARGIAQSYLGRAASSRPGDREASRAQMRHDVAGDSDHRTGEAGT
jgi:DNA-binding IclR family transcriptional regulator